MSSVRFELRDVMMIVIFLVAVRSHVLDPIEIIVATRPLVDAIDSGFISSRAVLSVVIFLECLCGSTLTFAATRRIGRFLSFLSVALFTATLITLGFMSGWGRPCGCGLGEMSLALAVSRNVLILSMMIVARVPVGLSNAVTAKRTSP